MSKPFIARCKGLLLLGCAAALLSGCELVGLLGDRDGSGSDALDLTAEAETPALQMPVVEPGLARRQWRAADSAARKVTGNLTASLENVRSGPLVLAFANGVTLRLESMGRTPGETPIAPGNVSFREALGDSQGELLVNVYRVVKEDVERVAPEGGLCKRQPTAYVAVAEYVDGGGDWVFRTASFAGAEPGPEAQGDPVLCGAYSYSLAP